MAGPQQDEVAEWLRRWTANPMCSAREGSNPFLVGDFEKNWYARPGQTVVMCVWVGAVIGWGKSLPIPGIEPGPPG